jgi:hypothetical protein
MPNAIGTSAIGPTFGGELVLKYPNLNGRPFTWGSDGSFVYSTDPINGITQTEKNEINDVYTHHDPVKSSLLDYSENARFVYETSGITVNGTFTQTDLQSQAALHAVYTYCQIHTGITIQWKLPDFTFVTYTSAQINNIFDKLNGFVQACFNKESTVNGQIVSGLITKPSDIDSAYATIPKSY